MIQVTMASNVGLQPRLALPQPAPPTPQEEANHRIANHLQLISALISIEARSVSHPETRSVLERMEQRIVAIGGVHRQLCTSAGGEVDLGDYLETLGEQLMRSCGSGRSIVVDAETVPVDSATASAVGVVASELITNACKHAYAPDEPGSIFIALRRRNDARYRFVVEDRGCRVTGPKTGSGLGSRLIKATVARLGGTMKWENAQPGTRFVMDFRP